MSFKSDWDKEVSTIKAQRSSLSCSLLTPITFFLVQVKARGTDISTEAATSAAKTKKTATVAGKPKTNHFAPPSGTARLTEKNLKKMELLEGGAAPQAPAGAAAKFSKDSRFKAREVDDR